MNVNDRKMRFAASILFGIPVGILVSYPFQLSHVFWLFSCFLLSSLFFLFFNVTLGHVQNSLAHAELKGYAFDSMHSMLYLKDGGMSTYDILATLSKSSGNETLKEIFYEINSRFRFGVGLEDAIDTCRHGETRKLFSSSEGPINFSDSTSIRNAMQLHEDASSSKRASLYEAAQRNATINMFISTVLPSFAIFGFVGSSIIGKQTYDMSLFSMTMLIFFPFISLAINALSTRRSYG